MLPVLDEEYFKRIEAVEFAIRQDDGKEPRGMEKADIILEYMGFTHLQGA